MISFKHNSFWVSCSPAVRCGHLRRTINRETWSFSDLQPRRGHVSASSPGLGDGWHVRAQRMWLRQRADVAQVDGAEGANCSIGAAAENHVLGQRQRMGHAHLQGRLRQVDHLSFKNERTTWSHPAWVPVGNKGYRRLHACILIGMPPNTSCTCPRPCCC